MDWVKGNLILGGVGLDGEGLGGTQIENVRTGKYHVDRLSVPHSGSFGTGTMLSLAVPTLGLGTDIWYRYWA